MFSCNYLFQQKAERLCMIGLRWSRDWTFSAAARFRESPAIRYFLTFQNLASAHTLINKHH